MAKNMLDTLSMSHPEPIVIHGIEIKKMPMKTYIDFVKKGARLVPFVIDKLFPRMDMPQVFAKALTIKSKDIYQFFMEMVVEAPELVFDALSELLGVKADDLLNNPHIGPNELFEIINAWNELNDLTGFLKRVGEKFHRPNVNALTHSGDIGINP